MRTRKQKCFLRDIKFDMVDGGASFDGGLVFDMGDGQLSAMSQLDMTSFLPAACDVVPCEQQVTVILAEISPESRYCHFAGTADLRT